MNMDDIYRRLENISDSVTQIMVSTARIEEHVNQNKLDLKEHMRRTDLLEQRIDLLQEDQIATHAMAKGQAKLVKWTLTAIGIIATSTGIILSVLEIKQRLGK